MSFRAAAPVENWRVPRRGARFGLGDPAAKLLAMAGGAATE